MATTDQDDNTPQIVIHHGDEYTRWWKLGGKWHHIGIYRSELFYNGMVVEFNSTKTKMEQ